MATKKKTQAEETTPKLSLFLGSVYIQMDKKMMYIRPGHEWHAQIVLLEKLVVYFFDGKSANPGINVVAKVCHDGICSSTSDHLPCLFPLSK